MITKNFNEIKYKVPEGLSLKQIEILEWAVTAYAFVMWPRTKFTFGELADAISNYYDRNTPQTSEAIQVLHAAQDGGDHPSVRVRLLASEAEDRTVASH